MKTIDILAGFPMRHLVIWTMVAVSLSAVAAIADPSPRTTPNMGASDLDDGEAKLKADEYYLEQLMAEDRDQAEALIRAVQKKRPGVRLWAMDVQSLFHSDVFTGKSLEGKEKVAHFKHAHEYLQESYDVVLHKLDKAHDELLREMLPGLQIDLVARFWADPNERTEANSKRVASDHLKQLESWKRQVRAGKVPTGNKWR